MHRAPGQLAVADFAPAGAAHAAGFAHRIGGEVVVQHEVFAVFAFQAVDDLLILPGAERDHAQRLRLAAGKQRAAVGAGQNAHFGHDLPHRLGVAAIDTQAGVEDGVANNIRLQILQHGLGGIRVQAFLGQLGDDGLLGRAHFFVARLLHALLIRRGDALAPKLADPRLQRDLGFAGLRQRPGVLRRMFRQLDDRLDHRLEGRVAERHRAEHHVLG